MTAVRLSRGVSVYEMMKLVGRAGVATKSGTAEEITNYLRALRPEELVEEFHRAVVTLSNRGMLQPGEQEALREYAQDWVRSQPLA